MAWPKPRVISLTKREGQTYGFFLRVEMGEDGHLIRALEKGGAAELAGLKDGDRLIRVNGTFVDNLDHSQVAELVKQSGSTVTFHVLEAEVYKEAKARGINLMDPLSSSGHAKPSMNGAPVSGPKLKLCFLQKSSSGYGFSVKSSKSKEGMFMTEVISGGVADKAGVKAGDRLVEVNRENVERATHDQVVAKVKAAGDNVLFLLVDEDTDKYYKNKRIKLGPGLATVKYLPQKPRIVEMTKGSNGYGYFLKEDPKLPGHFVGEIDRGSPAERGGLKEMDRVVAVDGEEIDNCTHEEVVEKIQALGNRCCLLLVDAETDKLYKKGGASPLLYWEEMRGSLPKPSQPDTRRDSDPVPVPVPVPITAMAAPTEGDFKPKLCRLEKSDVGFGFHLNSIQGVHGQYIKQVVKGGAADQAGLEDEDILVEVNGKNVEKCSHEEVVQMIRNTGDTLVLLVASKAAYDYLKAKETAITPRLLDTRKTSESSESDSESEDEKEEKEKEKQEEKQEEEKEEEKEQEKEEEKEEERSQNADVPQAESRERSPSASSSSSSDSEDERL